MLFGHVNDALVSTLLWYAVEVWVVLYRTWKTFVLYWCFPGP